LTIGLDPCNDGSRGSITLGCRHHKSRFYAPCDRKTQARSIDIRPGYCHGRGIDSFCNTRDWVSGRFSGRPRFSRTWLRWVILEIFFRKRISRRSSHVFSIYGSASLCHKWRCTDISTKFDRIKSWTSQHIFLYTERRIYLWNTSFYIKIKKSYKLVSRINFLKQQISEKIRKSLHNYVHNFNLLKLLLFIQYLWR